VHVLTKIFIVLVSLLAVLLVPLVVVYAYNENNYKAKFQEAEVKAAAAQDLVRTTEARAGSEQAKGNLENETLKREVQKLQTDKAGVDASVRELQSELAATRNTNAGIASNIQMINTALQANQELTNSLVNEVRELRNNAVAIERQKVELDNALSDVRNQLEVAEQARRALAEELARLKDDHNKTMADLNKAVAMGFNPKDDVRATAIRDRGIAPDKTLTAHVIRVERSSGQVLVEIDAGARDGVKKDWSMSIANGGDFIANLRITNVDINRSTGIVTLEKPQERGSVQVGNTAHAMAGQS